jgi:hypothetical protein
MITGKEIKTGAGYIPFGGGITYCPGRRFARNELKAALVQIFAGLEISILQTSIPEGGVSYDGSRVGIGIFPPMPNINIRATISRK